jgi:hypothetical protein
MNPWDAKLTYQLSEGELMQYVDHLQKRYDVDVNREDKIRELVDECENRWLNEAGKMQWNPRIDAFLFARPSWSPLDIYPDGSMTRAPLSDASIRVTLPPWVPREYVRFLADQQIREQWPENE